MNRSSEEKESFLEDHENAQHTRSKTPPTFFRRAVPWLRLLMEVVMILWIFVLTCMLWQPEENHQHTLQRTPVPQLPRKLYTFNSDHDFLHDNMFESENETLHTLHKWIPLSSDARGYISVADYANYPDLPEPHTIPIDRMHDGPGYMVSAFHQLHCLSYLTEHFGAAYRGSNLTTESAHHAVHCFDYLRQAIMCAGDTSLEGKSEAGPGWGSVHECVDYDALQAWANEHSAEKWRNDIMPEDSVL